MLIVRFQRVGRKNDPAFRIVVVERRSKPHASGIEVLGSFHPKTKHTNLNAERIRYWLGQGAHASPTVHNLLVRHGIIPGPKIAVVSTALARPTAPTRMARTKTSTTAPEIPAGATGE